VDNSQIAEVGKKFGVTYVCVAELVSLGDFFSGSMESMLTARFINVESATIEGATYKIDVLRGEDGIFATSEKLAGDLIADFKRRRGQTKLEHAAIYSAGGSESGVDKITQPLLINAVVRSGAYAVSERTSSFLESISQELGTQYSGDVDDNQLARLGVQSGVKYVMAIKRLSHTRVNLRMIDVKTGVIVPGMSKTGVLDITDVKSIEKSVAELISAFLGKETDALFTELKEESEAKKRKESEQRAEQERKESELRAEQERRQLVQEQADKRHEWQSMKKFGVTVGAGGTNGAFIGGVGAAYTHPIVRNLLVAPEVNLLFGNYENRWYGEDNYSFIGANVPVLLQYLTGATDILAFFVEAGAEGDLLMDIKDGFSLKIYGPVAGIGVALNLDRIRLYIDLGRFCYGKHYRSDMSYRSYMSFMRLMF